MEKLKKIHLCADDYALSGAVSRGIRELIIAKKLSSTSAMTVSPLWPEESDKLKEILCKKNINFKVGLHLTLTDSKPLTSMPSFTKKGLMPSINKLIVLSYLKQLPLDEIELELHAQIEKFISVFGGFPSHIDGHHHVHTLPGIRDIVLKLYKAYIYDNRVSIRSCCNNICNILFNGEAKIKSLIINFLSKTLHKTLLKNKIPTNDSFSGIYDFDLQDHSYFDIFKKFLLMVEKNNIIMCHPGYVDKELKDVENVSYQREKELKFFKSIEFDELLKKENCTLDV